MIYPHRNGFRVSYYDENKKRKFKSFKSKIDAKEFDNDQNFDRENKDFSISIDERFFIIQIRKEAKKAQIELVDLFPKIKTLIESLKMEEITVEDAIDLFLTEYTNSNARPATKKQHQKYLREFENGREKRIINSISRDEVKAHILARFEKDSSRRFVKVSLVYFFRWCQVKKWCSNWDAPIKWELEKTDEKLIEIIDVGKVSEIFRKAPHTLIPALALMFFAGIRPSEISDRRKTELLNWENINFEEKIILIPGSVAKTRRTRLLTDLPDNLWKWLELTPEKERIGKVSKAQTTFLRQRKSVFLEAGFDKVPDDAARHSFASYGFHFIGVEKTIDILGHTSPQMFFRHYKGAANAKKSKEFFSILPGGSSLMNAKKAGSK